ncbi:PREDICTED: ATP-dependent DNA helicase DDM1-like [Populus euphratica]|uniref:ATP-dependent DNA helicase DDM1-like n=1 Tax=Populus euphratica TaxID=75702 RepID=A0AAJ6UA55_POPEU|nr:PREDICTED: ATP-dependent DNA helicase DDM1-like [Populus euphratica]
MGSEVENEAPADSPTSVLEDEEKCKIKDEVKLEEVIFVEAKNEDPSFISKSMAEEEEKLLNSRIKEVQETVLEEAARLNESQYTRLDDLLTQTQLYSEFLLEQMDQITTNGVEQEDEPVKQSRGRGSKRKAAALYNSRKAKRAVTAMLTRSKEVENTEDANLTEEERVEKEQRELVPLLTGGRLKSYQIKGVKWLISLWQNGLNGILADQMGLGKTIQTIGFLAHLIGNGLHGPYLVIAPLSTLSNWVNEISRFVPSMDAIIYHGDKKQRDEIRRKHMPRSIGPKFPIIVTSYEIALSDAKKHLRHYPWKYLVVDEGHRLKNSKCKLLKELKHLCVDNKLILTGTPLQNNLAELWSLLNFILPDIFQSHEEFESWFDLSGKCNNEAMKEEVEERRRAQVVVKLHAILRPFLLRRLKTDVEQMLPRKKEIILYATLTEHQKKFQDHLINKTLEGHLREKMDTGRGMKGRLTNLMVQLRKNCYHPDLLTSAFDGTYFYPPVEQIVEQCGKFRLLDKLLNRLFALKHKVLIFSQWTKVLDIMDYYFSEKGFEVCRIDGSVNLGERKRQIEEFNDENSQYRVFLLSTRAGGLGINLTSADTCILYDSDWNPQMDLQAMDRCHRIGQTKPVHVYRLATAQSIEGRILKRAFSKLKLEHVVIGKGQFHLEQTKSKGTEVMEEEDILALLRDEETAEDKLIQTDISDEDLERVLDRSDLVVGSSDDDTESIAATGSFPLKGPGWEVVIPNANGGMLSTLYS